MASLNRIRWRRALNAFVRVLCLIVAVGLGGHATADDVYPRTPFARLETGMHTAPITRIDVDAAERYLVSGSHDKTVRIWDLRDGTLLRTLRIPIGSGYVGRIGAVAIAPDGNTIAAGGWTGKGLGDQVIYLFDRASGAVTGRISSIDSQVMHLAFSRDSRQVAATLWGQHGLRIYDTDNNRLVAEDKDYGADSYSAHFAAHGRLVTTCYDGYLRLYDASFRLVRKVKAPGGERPFMARFSPDGRSIAVGYTSGTQVNVVSAEDLGLLYSADTSDADNGTLNSVEWSADGQFLYAGGRYDAGGWNPVRRWADAGRGAFVDYKVGTSTVMDLKPLRDGGLAIGAQDPLLAVLAADGSVRWKHLGEIADFRNQVHATSIRVSETGDVVRFGYEVWGKRPARFSVSEMRLDLDPKDHPTLHGPDTTGLDVTDWYGTTTPKLAGKPLPLAPYETSRRLAIAPGGDRFLLGTDWRLLLFDRNGRELWNKPAPGTTWGVNITPDGRLAVAAYGDGTLRWHRMEDGRELLALFPHRDGKRWVAWTPEGFFAASPGAKDLVGYHLNRGADRVAEFVSVDQLYDVFYRPDLLVRRLNGDEQAITEAVNKIGDVDAILARGLPPEIELVGPAQVTVREPLYEHKFRVSDQGGGIGRIEYRIDGVLVGEDTRGVDLKRPGGVSGRPLELKPGKQVIEQTVYTADDTVASRTVRREVTYEAPKVQKPRLYGLIVGIDAYRDGDLTLKYAANDARVLKAALERQGRPLFDAIDLRLLTDGDARKQRIKTELEALAGRVKPTDVFVLYLAGHALADEGTYYFLPQELIYRNQRALKDGSLSEKWIKEQLIAINAGKTVVLLDTCYGGAFTVASNTRGPEMKTAFDRLMRATGRVFLVASTSVQQAREGYKGHGVFTYALLQGLEGNADRPDPHTDKPDGHVWIKELADYVEVMVPKYTEEKWQTEQFPMYDLHGQNFPIASTQ